MKHKRHVYRQHEASDQPARVMMHCPKCWRWTEHTVHIHGANEVLICTNPKCGHHLVFNAKQQPEAA